MKDLVIGKIRFVNHGRTLYKQEVRQTFQEYGEMSLISSQFASILNLKALNVRVNEDLSLVCAIQETRSPTELTGIRFVSVTF